MTFLVPPAALLTWTDYVSSGGGFGLAAAQDLGPDGTIEEIEAAGLRGRGGGGFPTGAKWRSIQRSGGGNRYVVVNGAEGEPATFKDRTLIRHDPFRIIEGAAIAAFAVGAETVYVATKRSFRREVQLLGNAMAEFAASGLLGGLELVLVEGPDDYLFGEEKALLEVIEGRDPLPRELPPWQHGLFSNITVGWEAATPSNGGPAVSNPTLVNNVETLATASHIMLRGASWFRTMGTADSPGTILATVVGDVQHPQVCEVELGTPFASLLSRCDGPLPGRTFKAALSGVSNAIVRSDDFDVALDYESFSAKGSGLGAAGFAIYDDTRSMVNVARVVSSFLARESCGQCPSCTRGCVGLTEELVRLENGSGDDGALPTMNALLRTVTDGNRCYLGTEEQTVVSSIMRAFPAEFASAIEGSTPSRNRSEIQLIDDLLPDGTVVLAHQRP